MTNSRITEEQLNMIRSAVDIVDVVEEYVQLKKQGRNFFGLCPFHGENTPSFSVAPDKQIFHCFGCGAGGNVFTFLMDIEGYSFLEAAKELAERGNVPIEIDAPESFKHEKQSGEVKKMIEAHELLAKFYHHLLMNTAEGEEALQYLLDRGFTKETIERFSIGYSLNSWEFVGKFLSKRGFDEETLEKAGIIIRKQEEDKSFDRFRNRIMFPIRNHNGEVIAFSGRTMGDDEPKYLNSPETPIFNKSKLLYNFHQARPAIRKKTQTVLFEGFADTISAYAAGVDNGVATMGTSLTDDHIQILKKNCSEVLICYDSDNPGLEAANKTANMLFNAGFTVKVAVMPDGMDPDEYIKKYSAERFMKDVITDTFTYLAFKMRFLRRGRNLNNEGDRISYIEDVLKEIKKLPNPVEREHYLRQLSTEFSLSLDTLTEQLKVMPSDRKKRGDAEAAVPHPSGGIVLQYEQKLQPAYLNAELRLIAHMMQGKEMAFKIRSFLGNNHFTIDEHQAIVTYLYGYYEESEDPDISLFLSYVPDPQLRKVITQIQMMSVSPEPGDQELKDYIQCVLKHQKLLKIREKDKDRKEAERLGDHVAAARIAMEIIRLKNSQDM
ncbi:MAG: DNA primase [Bacillus sp. (in: firmicutes)]